MPEIADLLEMVLNPSLHSFWFTPGSSGSFLFCFMEASVGFIENTLLFQFIQNLENTLLFQFTRNLEKTSILTVSFDSLVGPLP